MSNQDQAAQVIRTWQKRHKTVMDSDPDWAAQNLAGDLHQAGLLAPDPPCAWQADGKPPAGEWEYDYVASGCCAMSTGEYVDLKPGKKIRRWIGDWEEA